MDTLENSEVLPVLPAAPADAPVARGMSDAVHTKVKVVIDGDAKREKIAQAQKSKRRGGFVPSGDSED
jgi:hypothetical protein